MEYINFFQIYVYCWYFWEILRFGLSPFSSYAIHLLSYSFVEATTELRTEKKRKDTFKLKFYFGDLQLFCGVNDFLKQKK